MDVLRMFRNGIDGTGKWAVRTANMVWSMSNRMMGMGFFHFGVFDSETDKFKFDRPSVVLDLNVLVPCIQQDEDGEWRLLMITRERFLAEDDVMTENGPGIGVVKQVVDSGDFSPLEEAINTVDSLECPQGMAKLDDTVGLKTGAVSRDVAFATAKRIACAKLGISQNDLEEIRYRDKASRDPSFYPFLTHICVVVVKQGVKLGEGVQALTDVEFWKLNMDGKALSLLTIAAASSVGFSAHPTKS